MKNLLFFIMVFSSSLYSMEMREVNNTPLVSAHLLAAVTKVPAITTLLSEHYVTAPLDISRISFQDQKIVTLARDISEDEFRLYDSSLNYFNCTNKDGKVINHAMLRDFDNKTYPKFSRVRDWNSPEDVTVCDFFFDGPNRNGNCVSCMRTYDGENPLVFFTNKKKSLEKTFWRQSVWTVALSDGDLVALSSVSHQTRAALLKIYACRPVKKANKILFVSRQTEELQLNLLKESTLSDEAFHAFTNLSFLTEGLLLGRNQHGQLYLVEPRCDKKDDLPIFHHLTAQDKSFSSVKSYALDSYDKNRLLLVDNTDGVRIAKITSRGLVTNRIRSLEDIRNTTGNTAKNLLGIRMAGNVCYFFFGTQDAQQTVCVQFSLIEKQLSPKDKLDLIKKNYRYKVS